MILTDIDFFDLVLWDWVKSHGYTDTVVTIGFILMALVIGVPILQLLVDVVKHKIKHRGK